jgi:nucleoside-triphosphatase
MPALFLTGAPGSGKTTAIRRILAASRHDAGGFYTREIRVAGRRLGFEIVTLDGQTGLLAHLDISGPPRVGRYGVDLTALEDIGVESLQAAARRGALVVIDEIGPMECLSAAFRQTVEAVLDGGADVLGTVAAHPAPFPDRIKARPDVSRLPRTPAHRESLAEQVIVRRKASRR